MMLFLMGWNFPTTARLWSSLDDLHRPRMASRVTSGIIVVMIIGGAIVQTILGSFLTSMIDSGNSNAGSASSENNSTSGLIK